MELLNGNHIHKHTVVKLLAIALILIAFIRFNYPAPPASDYSSPSAGVIGWSVDECDVFTGEWIPNPSAPYYTNSTCWAIHEHQNCIKYGRPDTEYLKWRWKPDQCELPVFDPLRFLEMVRGKSMAFVGDSVGRNQMQSMICLLSRVEYPNDVSPTPDEQFKVWSYEKYNFTLSSFWAPFLVHHDLLAADGPTQTGLFNLHLDKPDPSWDTKIDGFDFVILNSGHWFTRPAVYYENHRISGCHFCQIPNTTDLPVAYAYRRAFRTAFRSIQAREDFSGVVFLRTFAPSHFENGLWNEGGNCLRRRPFRSSETVMDGMNLEFYMSQVEEFRLARGEGKKEFRLLDLTPAMLLRPDGHPSRYGHWPEENVTLYNDCVHWCLPGPIDSWADFLIHMMEMEDKRMGKNRLGSSRE